MPSKAIMGAAADIAELTFQLLASCQEKEQRIAKDLGITVPEFRLLRIFRGAKHIPVRNLVERSNLSGSRLTRILDSLEKGGYLMRSIDPTDRRVITATLSKKGLELSRVMEENYLRIHQEILDGIPKELHAPMISGMHNMLSTMDRWLHHTK